MSNQQQKDKVDKTATYSAALKNNSRSYDINNMYIDKKVMQCQWLDILSISQYIYLMKP